MPAGNLCHRQIWKVRMQPTISVTIKVSKDINIWWTVWLLRVLAACQCGGTTSIFSRKCLSWITSDYTAHLHTTVSVRREYHLSDLLMWITMASVFDSVFFSWDSLRVILILGVCLEKYTFNQTFRIYFTTFGSINYPSCSYYQASRLDFFSYFLGPRWPKLTPKECFKNRCDPGCIQDVIHVMNVSFCRSTTSHENKVVNLQMQEEVLCDWVSSKILGFTFVVFSLCLAITCHPFALYRSIGS